MHLSKKTIGVLVPLSALYTTTSPTATFEAGVLFLDWLLKTEQNAWQMLPLHETQLEKGSIVKHVPSPYKGYGIGLDPKYLSDKNKNIYPNDSQLHTFQKEHGDWLSDYTLFCALRDRFGTDDWTTWDSAIRKRDSKTIARVKKELRNEIKKYAIKQWQAHHAYASLRNRAKEKNILLIGDIPFYIGFKSPFVWAYQDIFHLASNGSMVRVSGSLHRPNAYFGRQLWGHPLYLWDNPSCIARILCLWKIRLTYAALLFDVVRLDHANGFFHYGSLDPKDPKKDEKKIGPGFAIFAEIVDFGKSIGLTVYVEDAAVELKELRYALTKLHVAGVNIFRFAINERRNIVEPDYANPWRYPANSCAYTSLHDTEPLLGFLRLLSVEQKKLLAREAHVAFSPNDEELVVRLRQAVIASPSRIVIIPIQDWLLTRDRINTPGTEQEKDDPNWHYRLASPVEQLPSITY